jgi:hypothetical protein
MMRVTFSFLGAFSSLYISDNASPNSLIVIFNFI